MGSPVVVRDLEADDLERLLDQLEEIAAEGRWIGLEAPIDRGRMRARLAERLGDPDGLQLVAEEGGRLVGNLGAWTIRPGVASLGMSVVASWRGRGVGTALVERAISWARGRHLHKLVLEVFPHNEAAITLYRKAGFVEEGVLRRHYRRRNGELWDAIVMARHLDG